MEIYLTCNDAAKVVKVSPDSIRLYEKTGKLAAIKTASGIRLFRKRDVERFARMRQEAKRTRV